MTDHMRIQTKTGLQKQDKDIVLEFIRRHYDNTNVRVQYHNTDHCLLLTWITLHINKSFVARFPLKLMDTLI